MAGHPSVGELLAGGPEVAAHLERCPRCRIEQRLAKRSALATLPVSRPPEPTPTPLPTVAPGRYTELGPLGLGGMGVVTRVSDPVLGRSVALKTLRSDKRDVPGATVAFVEEARRTAVLEHPGIVPVYALGQMPDGREFFTMQEVVGRTLSEVTRAVFDASPTHDWGRTPDGWSLRRLVDVVRRVAETVAYAHARGVVHCDLKPANIMLGSWGEVRVLDWGIARELSGNSADRRVAGTPAYMAPEQARGEPVGPAADIWAIGAVLFHVLSSRPPFPGSASAVLRQVAGGATPPRLDQQHYRPLPEELVRLCSRLMSPRVQDRPATMEAVAQALTEWLDGAHRRAQAEALVAEAATLRPRIAEALAEADALTAAVASHNERVPPTAPVAEKRAVWALEDRAEALRQDARLIEVEMVRTLQAALRLDGDLGTAHDALAALYRERHVAAEAVGDGGAVLAAEALLNAHNRGSHDAYLAGTGALSLVTEPDGVEVWCSPYVEVDRRLVLGPATRLGTTPLSAVALKVGSYRLDLRKPGFQSVIYPIEVRRLAHWDAVPPGASAAHPVRLPRLGELSEDDCLVPAGWFRSGGDAEAASALPATQLWCPGFVMKRTPVTHGQFIAFLDDLVARGREDEALQYAPQEHGQGSWSDRGPTLYGRDASGRFFLQPDAEGDVWKPNWPVFLIDGWGSWAYADWLAERTGQPWRLPAELEWEKAARGVDGRLFPWGRHLDPTFACVRASHTGHPLPAEVDAWPLDRSPYGVTGLAGNMVDRCADGWEQKGPDVDQGRVVLPSLDRPEPGFRGFMTAKGGSWYTYPRYARSAWRIRSAWLDRTISVGFRLARSWP